MKRKQKLSRILSFGATNQTDDPTFNGLAFHHKKYCALVDGVVDALAYHKVKAQKFLKTCVGIAQCLHGDAPSENLGSSEEGKLSGISESAPPRLAGARITGRRPSMKALGLAEYAGMESALASVDKAAFLATTLNEELKALNMMIAEREATRKEMDYYKQKFSKLHETFRKAREKELKSSAPSAVEKTAKNKTKVDSNQEKMDDFTRLYAIQNAQTIQKLEASYKDKPQRIATIVRTLNEFHVQVFSAGSFLFNEEAYMEDEDFDEEDEGDEDENSNRISVKSLEPMAFTLNMAKVAKSRTTTEDDLGVLPPPPVPPGSGRGSPSSSVSLPPAGSARSSSAAPPVPAIPYALIVELTQAFDDKDDKDDEMDDNDIPLDALATPPAPPEANNNFAFNDDVKDMISLVTPRHRPASSATRPQPTGRERVICFDAPEGWLKPSPKPSTAHPRAPNARAATAPTQLPITTGAPAPRRPTREAITLAQPPPRAVPPVADPPKQENPEAVPPASSKLEVPRRPSHKRGSVVRFMGESEWAKIQSDVQSNLVSLEIATTSFASLGGAPDALDAVVMTGDHWTDIFDSFIEGEEEEVLDKMSHCSEWELVQFLPVLLMCFERTPCWLQKRRQTLLQAFLLRLGSSRLLRQRVYVFMASQFGPSKHWWAQALGDIELDNQLGLSFKALARKAAGLADPTGVELSWGDYTVEHPFLNPTLRPNSGTIINLGQVDRVFKSNAKPLLVTLTLKGEKVPECTSGKRSSEKGLEQRPELKKVGSRSQKLPEPESPTFANPLFELDPDEAPTPNGPTPMLVLKQGDDICQDLAMMEIFRCFNHLWAKEPSAIHNGCPVVAREYGCIPYDKQAGLIEFVAGCVTLAKVKKLKPRAINYGWKAQLVASAAGSYIASYVLGIRDRHHDNVLIHEENGYLFHIDFGKILGDSVAVDTGEFAITTDLKKVMDDRWEDFVSLCLKAYLVLRAHSVMVMELCSTMLARIKPNSQEFLMSSLMLDRQPEAGCLVLREKILSAPKNLQTRFKNAMHKVAVKVK